MAKHFDRVLGTKGFTTLPNQLQEEVLAEIQQNFVSTPFTPVPNRHSFFPHSYSIIRDLSATTSQAEPLPKEKGEKKTLRSFCVKRSSRTDFDKLYP